MLRAVELALLERSAHLNSARLSPDVSPDVVQHPARVAPGSASETAALQRIEEMRDEEMDSLNDTFAARRRRQRNHWRRSI